jgi:hypothetical protein
VEDKTSSVNTQDYQKRTLTVSYEKLSDFEMPYSYWPLEDILQKEEYVEVEEFITKGK